MLADGHHFNPDDGKQSKTFGFNILISQFLTFLVNIMDFIYFIFYFFQTDGASACLIMSEEKALAMGFKPKAYLR